MKTSYVKDLNRDAFIVRLEIPFKTIPDDEADKSIGILILSLKAVVDSASKLMTKKSK